MLMAAVRGVELDIIVRFWIEDVLSEVFGAQQPSSLKAKELTEFGKDAPVLALTSSYRPFPYRYKVLDNKYNACPPNCSLNLRHFTFRTSAHHRAEPNIALQFLPSE